MPKGVVKGPKQEKIWDYKTKQVEKQTGKKSSQFTDNEWRRVNFLFQKAKKKYKGKLPKKYTEASFKSIVAASYTVITSASELDKLHEELKQAELKIGLLCKGFDVQLEPSYDKIINKVVKNVDHWENTDRIAEEDRIPILLYHRITSATGLPPSLFNQFHDKFLDIVKTTVLPAIKAYMQKNPKIKIKTFKPLLNVAIK